MGPRSTSKRASGRGGMGPLEPLRRLTKFLSYVLSFQTQVHMNIYSLGRSEKYWDEPNKFKPQRWLRQGGKNFHPFAYIPFGAGPRMCIGELSKEPWLFYPLQSLHFSFLSFTDWTYEILFQREQTLKCL